MSTSRGSDGRRSRPKCGGVDDYTRLMEEFISTLGIKRPTLLGHSFGGRVGILYASRHDDVEALILVDAAGIKPHRTLKYYWKVYIFKAMKRLMYLVYGREEAERRLDVRRAKAGSSDYASASPMMRRILSRVVNEDLTDRLALVKAPHFWCGAKMTLLRRLPTLVKWSD